MTTILVVDDCAVDREDAGKILAAETDCQVEYAQNGLEALAKIQQSLPELIVTDLQMPGMNGLELVLAVQKMPVPVPIILMTSPGSEAIALQALEAGASSYTPKSRLDGDLLTTVRSVLAIARQQRGNEQLIERMTRNRMNFVLDNDSNLIPPLINLVQEKVIQVGQHDPSEQIRLGIALEEALVNAVFHGNLEISSQLREREDNAYYRLADDRRQQPPYNKRRVHVEAGFSAIEMVFVVRDEGPGYDPSTLPDPRDPENLERVYGRGLLLIRTFMDEVLHNEPGNQITMIKRRRLDGP